MYNLDNFYTVQTHYCKSSLVITELIFISSDDCLLE